MKLGISALVAASVLTFAQPAAADVTVGGFTFEDNAFADTLIASSGSFTFVGPSLASALTDSSASTYAFSNDTGAFVTLGFTDNLLVNGAGADLVLFELGIPDPFRVTINGISATYATTNTGFTAAGFNLNAAAIDLTLFGILSGASVTQVMLEFPNNGTRASTALVGALNSANAVPEPSTWAMLIGGVGLMGGVMRRRARSSVRFA